ncbi:hypothetical protein PG910_06390 [Tenacibaculum dicentrarchi]|nr:hypothetical protein [Tenacibaculum dicentrarchi]WBX67761.1 hypothetical protein PG910_06390 [Tenacibaculum dicentrarchi]
MILEQTIKKIFLIEGKIQHYDWGGKKFISNLIKRKKILLIMPNIG